MVPLRGLPDGAGEGAGAAQFAGCAGAGTRLRLGGHFNASLDLGLPLTAQSATAAHDWRLTFRAWSEF